MVTCKVWSLIPAMLLSLAAAAQTDAIKLRIDGNNYYDETIVRFVNDATTGFDGNYDAWKFFSPNAQVPSLYTQIDSASPLSINALPSLVRKTVVGVHANINVAGTYTITPTEVGAFPQGICITLEDAVTGSYYDMRSGTAPSFNLTAGNNNGQPRFRLHFSTPVTLSVTDVLCYSAHDGEVILSKAGTVNWFYSVSDSAGNNVASGAGISDGDTLTGLAAGTYTLTSLAPYGCPETSVFTVDQPASMQPSFVPSDSVAYQSQAMIHFMNTTGAANAYSWDFGDGSPASSQSSPVHNYISSGDFAVTLTATDGACSETVSRNISILPDVATGTAEAGGEGLNIYAAGNSLVLEGASLSGQLSVYDLAGREVMKKKIVEGPKASVDLRLPGGYYLVQVAVENDIFIKKIFVGAE